MLRDYLITLGLPVKSYFRESTIVKKQVQKAYSLLNLLSVPEDIISLRFLIGFGSANFKNNEYKILNKLANENQLTLIETLRKINEGKLKGKGFPNIIKEFNNIASILETIKKEIIKKPYEAFQNIFIKTEEDRIEFYDLNQLYKKAIEEVGTKELESNQNLFQSWFQSVFIKIIECLAIPDSPYNLNHIRIMSVHASKGLSAKFVIVCLMIDRLLPYIPKYLNIDERKRKLEEERRLFYVALTRCKASENYPGGLIISTFYSIPKVDSGKMKIPADSKDQHTESSTRFLKDFGGTSPKPILGDALL